MPNFAWYNSKIKNKEYFYKLFRYIIIGFFTTLISFGSFWLMLERVNIEANLANTVSVLIAITFAFFTNKYLVFKSSSNHIFVLLGELLRFVLSRAVTLLLEIGGLFVLHNLLLINAIYSKVMISVVVLILNYLAFQYVVFIKKR